MPVTLDAEHIMKIRNYLAATAAALTLSASALSAPARAAENDGIPGAFSANVALTSEYYFRGLSQTDDSPALQGGFDYEIGLTKGFKGYFGVWGSNVDFNDGTDGATLELDLYGGLRGEIGGTGVGWDAGFIYYTYPTATSSLNYNFVEAQGALSYDFGIASASVSVNYTGENFGDSGDALYPKLSVDVPVGKSLTLSAHVAKQWIDKEDVFGSPDYTDWSLGATYSLAGFDLNVTYTDTDISPSGDGNSEAVLFTVSRSF